MNRRVVALVWLAGACATGASRIPGDPLDLGTYGGDRAGVIATDSVTHVHIGCTFGDIPGRVPIDAKGRFAIAGSFILKAFPVVMGPRLPAQFSGRLVGRSLSISVAVNDTTTGKVVSLGPVTVVLGQPPQLGPCPICRVPKMPAAPGGSPAPDR